MQPRHTGKNAALERRRQRLKPKTSSKLPTARRARRSATEQQSQAQPCQQVLLSIHLPHARSVCVAGTFNNWDPAKTAMEKDGTSWKAALSLPPGRYEYKFVADGQWMSDPGAKESEGNDFGGSNSILVV
jgi:1,4-alpha-glucan branching enzyme